MEVKVFTWNVLSSAFFKPEEYPTYDEKYFDDSRRRSQILAKLRKVMDNRYLIALYEVSDDLRSELVVSALEHCYMIRDAYYGDERTGNMGIVVMWPQEYRLVKYQQVVIGQRIKSAPKPSRSCWQWLNGTWPEDPVAYAKSRKNVLIAATLAVPGGHGEVVLAAYHVPCAIHMREVMKLHVEAVWDTCLGLGTQWDPNMIICMDMNTKPDDELYKFFPENGMVSAHAFEGHEPEFTTNTQSRFLTEPFKATIDYVWVSKQYLKKVMSRMPTKYTRLLPNDKFPSDHYWMEFHLTFGERPADALSL